MIFWKYEEYMLEIIIVSHLKSCISEKFPELLDSAKPERKGRNKQNT